MWAASAVVLSLLHGGANADNLTRVLVIVVLAVQLAVHAVRPRALVGAVPFVLRCTAGALVVELCYMPSRPVYASLLWTLELSASQLAARALVDWAVTLPAYLVIYAVYYALLRRWRYRTLDVVVVLALAQALGDGGAFFLAQPAMLLLAPYVMLNYQAILVVPWLRARDSLDAGARRPPGVVGRVVPLLLLPAVYFALGALIIVVGRALQVEARFGH